MFAIGMVFTPMPMEMCMMGNGVTISAMARGHIPFHRLE